MITLNILDVKKTMEELLKGNLFDEFEARDIEIHTFTKFHISGILNKDFLSTDEKELYNSNYILWKEIKKHVFNIIKGKKSPTYFKIVLSANKDLISNFSSEISALFINMIYTNNKLTCTTGTALKTFILDKSYEYQWDKYIYELFYNSNILVEKNNI
ncbi:DUF5721 family protein [Defluviitalea phaphyphila]|uniref:DUF5721 family protein n=1 Tax=Defluviitalea phaphyphila TaxID=1473580 RepID=UPI000730FFD1|nr:DUF5721 family protein [Defluviitalea phaphyphila]